MKNIYESGVKGDLIIQNNFRFLPTHTLHHIYYFVFCHPDRYEILNIFIETVLQKITLIFISNEFYVEF